MFGRVYRYTDTRGIVGRRTELTQVSGTGIEVVPNLTGVFGRVLMPYRTLPNTWVGYLLTNKYPQNTVVHTLPNMSLGIFVTRASGYFVTRAGINRCYVASRAGG